jgi:hypothetical protein
MSTGEFRPGYSCRMVGWRRMWCSRMVGNSEDSSRGGCTWPLGGFGEDCTEIMVTCTALQACICFTVEVVNSMPAIHVDRRVGGAVGVVVGGGIVSGRPIVSMASSSCRRRAISLLSNSSCAALFVSKANSGAGDLWEAVNCFVFTDLFVELPVGKEKLVCLDLPLV